MNKPFSFKRNMIWNSIGSSVYTVCQALTTILVLRLSDFNVAGNLSLAISITAIFTNIAHYNIRNYQVSDILPKYRSGIYLSSRIITCFSSLILCLLFILIHPYSLYQNLCIILYMIFRISEVLIDTLYGIDQLADRMDILGRSFIFRGMLTLFSFVISLMLTKNLLLSILLMVISNLMIAFFYDIPNSKRLNSIKPVFDLKQIKALLIECSPLAINLIISGSIISIPRLYLQNDYSSKLLGIYTMVASPIIVVQVLSSYLLTPLLTVLAQHLVNREIKGFISVTLKCTLALSGISVAALIGAMVLGKIALSILFGTQILPYYYLLLPAIWFSILQLGTNLISTVFTVIRKLIPLTISNVVLLISCLAVSPYFVKKYQMQGVNYSLILSTVIQIIFLIAFMTYIMFQYFHKQRGPKYEA